MDKLNVLIAGATGYIGTQLVKLLCKHKNVKIKYLCGNTSVGKNISYYDNGLKKYKYEALGRVPGSPGRDQKHEITVFRLSINGTSENISKQLIILPRDALNFEDKPLCKHCKAAFKFEKTFNS